ncbi:MAG: sigma-70 family RNA polymerase sigma factor [Luteolibacter sp.]|uniref:RNA polymerase sigma factor n=1 Tax=Luteolibacter sp. TaxID=1962973 RepID=UPI00326522D9
MEVNASTSTVVPAIFGISDTELLQAWVRHQRQADFTEIVRRHLGLVRGIARRQVGTDLADDTAQMVFAILARKASGLTELRSLGSWLHRVTMLQCRGVIRGQIRDRRSHQSAMESARLADARDPLSEMLPYLDSAICDLPDSDRELIHLRYSDRLTFPEVARRTGRSEQALRQQAGRALEKLVRLLQRRGAGVSVATVVAGLGTTLTRTSSASAAGSISNAAITSAALSGGSWATWIILLTMNTKKYMLVVGLIATLVALLGVWKNRETKGLADPGASSSAMSPQSGSSFLDKDSAPAKTKVDRSRAVTPPSPEEALKMKDLQRRAVDNARQCGLALFEFESEYGSFPNEETAAAVKEATGTKADLKGATANDCFFQLIAAGFAMTDSFFSLEPSPEGEDRRPKPLMNLEKCAFSYLSGMNAAGDPSRPLVVTPLVPGTGIFDRKALGGKAVILRVDNSATTVDIEQDGTVILNGMDLFDPAQPFWAGKVPSIRWPEK